MSAARRRVSAGIVAAAAGALACAPVAQAVHRLRAIRVQPAGFAGGARPAQTPLFRVGVAVADLTPPAGVAVYSGGYGASPPIYGDQQLAGDGLSARALYVSNGHRAVVLVAVDSQGLFAAVQQASDDPRTTGLGTTGMRTDGAAAVGQLVPGGPSLGPDDIIVQGSHSHSAPTLLGIWGPVPLVYLQEVHDRVVQAIAQAARSARTAYLQYASVQAPDLDNILTSQTDSYQGWQQDGQVSVLRALDPASGATLATYANVPAHPDLVDGAGIAKDCVVRHIAPADCPALTGDYMGQARGLIESQLGGVAIVSGATLGREESPVQGDGITAMRRYSQTVDELVLRALTHPHWVEDSAVSAVQRWVHAPGTNPLLLSLVAAWSAPPPVRDQLIQQTGTYPIDRADTPPYQTGNVVGTPTAALRIGPLAYLTLNGEAFPEIRQSIASQISGPAMIVGLSLGNDQLGYYAPTVVWPFMNGLAPYHSDHFEYNISPALGDEMIQAQVSSLRELGFSGPPVALGRPGQNDYPAMLHPGLQALAYPARGDADSTGTYHVQLQGIYGDAALPDSLGDTRTLDGPIHWSFGDGTTADVPAPGGSETAVFSHAYRPGAYLVTLTARDSHGDTASWRLPVVAYPRLTAGVTSHQNTNGSITYTARASGGDGAYLAWRWSFSDGTTAAGPVVIHTFPAGVTPSAAVTVTDGTGTTAVASS